MSHVIDLFQATPYQGFLNYRSLFMTKCHPNLWQNLVNGYSNANTEEVRVGLAKKAEQPGGTFEVLKSQPDILTETTFRTREISQVLPKNPQKRDYYLKAINRAIESKKPDSFFWSSSHHEFVIRFAVENNVFKGWLHIHNTGDVNSEVWLIVNPTTAVYYLFD